MTDRPLRLPAFFDAWGILCASGGRRSLFAALALETGTADLREAVAAALVALGYPEAMASPRALGAALRALRGLRDGQGRYLDRSVVSGGAAIWYVTGGPPAGADVPIAQRVLGANA